MTGVRFNHMKLRKNRTFPTPMKKDGALFYTTRLLFNGRPIRFMVGIGLPISIESEKTFAYKRNIKTSQKHEQRFESQQMSFKKYTPSKNDYRHQSFLKLLLLETKRKTNRLL